MIHISKFITLQSGRQEPKRGSPLARLQPQVANKQSTIKTRNKSISPTNITPTNTPVSKPSTRKHNTRTFRDTIVSPRNLQTTLEKENLSSIAELDSQGEDEEQVEVNRVEYHKSPVKMVKKTTFSPESTLTIVPPGKIPNPLRGETVVPDTEYEERTKLPVRTTTVTRRRTATPTDRQNCLPCHNKKNSYKNGESETEDFRLRHRLLFHPMMKMETIPTNMKKMTTKANTTNRLKIRLKIHLETPMKNQRKGNGRDLERTIRNIL